VSFRMDAELRQKAAHVCADLGHDLHDVLRALITQIARHGRLPFAMGPSPPPAVETPANVVAGEPRLWADLSLQIQAETALTLLTRVIVELSVRLDEALDAPVPDEQLVAALTTERGAA